MDLVQAPINVGFRPLHQVVPETPVILLDGRSPPRAVGHINAGTAPITAGRVS